MPRPSCLSVPIKSKRLMSQAGASPKTVPAATETARANTSTPQLIDMSFRCGRLSGIKPQQEFPGEEENRKTGDPAKQEEQQTLGEKLADEARSLRSQSLANRDLTTSHTGPGKQKIGDVDATDQQDQSHRAEQQNERLANAADHAFAERTQAHGPCGLCRILRRILLFQRFNQRIEVPLRGRNRETGLQARDRATLQTCTAQRGRKRQTGHAGRQPRFRFPLLAG